MKKTLIKIVISSLLVILGFFVLRLVIVNTHTSLGEKPLILLSSCSVNLLEDRAVEVTPYKKQTMFSSGWYFFLNGKEYKLRTKKLYDYPFVDSNYQSGEGRWYLYQQDSYVVRSKRKLSENEIASLSVEYSNLRHMTIFVLSFALFILGVLGLVTLVVDFVKGK